MSKATSLLRQIERRIAARRRPAVVMVMSWNDEDVTDADGRRMSLAEWQQLHPDGKVIQIQWGDEDPADVLPNV